jgi:hypothetical protein
MPFNRGQIAAAKAGLEYILTQEYEYVARMGAGDFAHQERLAFLDEHPECMMVGCDSDILNGGEYEFTLRPPRNEKALASALHEHSWLMIRPSFCGLRY